jgi:hypothetical protein
MISDCRGPNHSGELVARDDWRGVRGFSVVTVSFITFCVLAKLER